MTPATRAVLQQARDTIADFAALAERYKKLSDTYPIWVLNGHLSNQDFAECGKPPVITIGHFRRSSEALAAIDSHLAKDAGGGTEEKGGDANDGASRSKLHAEGADATRAGVKTGPSVADEFDEILKTKGFAANEIGLDLVEFCYRNKAIILAALRDAEAKGL